MIFKLKKCFTNCPNNENSLFAICLVYFFYLCIYFYAQKIFFLIMTYLVNLKVIMSYCLKKSQQKHDTTSDNEHLSTRTLPVLDFWRRKNKKISSDFSLQPNRNAVYSYSKVLAENLALWLFNSLQFFENERTK